MKKAKYIAALLFVIAASLTAYEISLIPTFKYFYLACTIFDHKGLITSQWPEFSLCAFGENGQILASNQNNRLVLLDQNDNELWSSTERAHHDLKFSKDGEGFLLITDEINDFKNYFIRSDCFAKRDMNNKVLHQWCLSDHLQELNSLDFHVHHLRKKDPADLIQNPLWVYEISHANSIYEIEENARSGFDPAFKPGNYIINLGGEICALLILDPEMKKILWHKNFCQIKTDLTYIRASTHDVQVAENGNILAYVNFFSTGRLPSYARRDIYDVVPATEPLKAAPYPDIENIFKIDLGFFCCKPKKNDAYSSLVEFDPDTERLQWRYPNTPDETFKSEIGGTVTKLENGNYLFNLLGQPVSGIEISPEGGKVWEFKNPVRYNLTLPTRVLRIRPLELSFFRARKMEIND